MLTFKLFLMSLEYLYYPHDLIMLNSPLVAVYTV